MLYFSFVLLCALVPNALGLAENYLPGDDGDSIKIFDKKAFKLCMPAENDCEMCQGLGDKYDRCAIVEKPNAMWTFKYDADIAGWKINDKKCHNKCMTSLMINGAIDSNQMDNKLIFGIGKKNIYAMIYITDSAVYMSNSLTSKSLNDNMDVRKICDIRKGTLNDFKSIKIEYSKDMQCNMKKSDSMIMIMIDNKKSNKMICKSSMKYRSQVLDDSPMIYFKNIKKFQINSMEYMNSCEMDDDDDDKGGDDDDKEPMPMVEKPTMEITPKGRCKITYDGKTRELKVGRRKTMRARTKEKQCLEYKCRCNGDQDEVMAECKPNYKCCYFKGQKLRKGSNKVKDENGKRMNCNCNIMKDENGSNAKWNVECSA